MILDRFGQPIVLNSVVVDSYYGELLVVDNITVADHELGCMDVWFLVIDTQEEAKVLTYFASHYHNREQHYCWDFEVVR